VHQACNWQHWSGRTVGVRILNRADAMRAHAHVCMHPHDTIRAANSTAQHLCSCA
jgi:hypothetical protein